MAEVYQMLKAQQARDRGALQLQGKIVRQKAFRSLLQIGRSRFCRIRAAVLNEESCPRDQRFSPKGPLHCVKFEERRVLMEYFEELYFTVAEPLPEAAVEGEVKFVQKTRRRGKRPRHLYRLEPRDQKGYCPGTKFLPPGTISGYLELFHAKADVPRVSRTLFCKETWSV